MGSQRWVLPLYAHGSTEKGTVYLSVREGHWKQFHTKCSLIIAPQWYVTGILLQGNLLRGDKIFTENFGPPKQIPEKFVPYPHVICLIKPNL